MFDDLSFRMFEMANDGLCCSQILVALAMESQDTQNPDLVRAMGGLCYGSGSSNGLCGVLIGGICLLSLKSSPDSSCLNPGKNFLLIAEQYREWFEQTVSESYGGTQCSDILGRDAQQYPDLGRCSEILTNAYSKLMEIMEEHDS